MKKVVTGLMTLAAFALLCGTAAAEEVKSAPAQMVDKAKSVAQQAEASANAADAAAAGAEMSAGDQTRQLGKDAMNAVKEKAMEKAEGVVNETKDKMMNKAKDAMGIKKADDAAEGVKDALDSGKKADDAADGAKGVMDMGKKTMKGAASE